MKSPSFQFYPGDWLASQRVQLMTLEEEGAYIRLLCYCWVHGSIPSDPAAISRLIGKGGSTTLVSTIVTMFQADGDKLVHERLESERSKQAEWREKSSLGGKKSAKVRWGGKNRKGGVSTLKTVVTECFQPNGNSSVSSLLSSNLPKVPNGERDLKPTTPEALRVASLFHRRASTEWSEKEISAYKKAKLTAEDLEILEPYYASEQAKGEDGRQRRDLLTFLNNAPGEVDRARAWAAQSPKSNGIHAHRPKLPPPPTAPNGY